MAWIGGRLLAGLALALGLVVAEPALADGNWYFSVSGGGPAHHRGYGYHGRGRNFHHRHWHRGYYGFRSTVILAPPPVYYVAPPPPPPPPQTCARFHGNATVDGRGTPFYGVACLRGDGRWHIVSGG